MRKRREKKSKSYGFIFIALYFIGAVIVSGIFQIKMLQGESVLEFLPPFLERYIVNNLVWFIMLFTLLIFWGIFVIQSKLVRRKFKIEDRYYSYIPTKLPPMAVAAMYEDEYFPCVDAEFAYFIEMGYIEIIENKGRTTFRANKYPTKADGMWDYQIQLFEMFFSKIAGQDGIIDLEDLERLEQFKGASKHYLFSVVNILERLDEELKEKGYIKGKRRKLFDLEDISGVLPELALFYLIGGYLLVHKVLISIPMIIYFIVAMMICKNRIGKKDVLTSKGIEEYNTIASFRQFLENYTITEDRGVQDLKLLKMFLVYAASFRLADKLCKEITASGIHDVVVSIIKSLVKFENKGEKHGGL